MRKYNVLVIGQSAKDETLEASTVSGPYLPDGQPYDNHPPHPDHVPERSTLGWSAETLALHSSSRKGEVRMTVFNRARRRFPRYTPELDKKGTNPPGEEEARK